MMMMGDTGLPNPIVQVPPWDLLDDPTAMMGSPFSISALSVNLNGNATSPNGDNNCDAALTASLQRYLPSNVNNFVSESDVLQGEDYDIPVNAFSCDQFRMFEFKVRRCARGRSHDWTECPYAHPGEKARRRDPRKYNYSGTVCSEFRKGQCKKGDSCELAHGVFESWLHPSRYRTQPCKDGTHCRRRVCFFAHTPDQLRVLPQTSPRLADSFDGSPSRLGLESYGSFGSSPTSTLYSPPVSPPSDSPPMSPHGSLCVNSVSELAASVRNLQIGKARMSVSPPSWGIQMGSGFCSPRSRANLRPGFLSLPSTPTRVPTRSGLGVFELWERNCEEEPVMERVESGKELRAQIYAKLSKENSLDRVRVESASPGPDVGWVSELVM